MKKSLLIALITSSTIMSAQKTFNYLSKGYFTENEITEMITDEFAKNLFWIKVYKVNNIRNEDFYKLTSEEQKQKFYSAYQLTGFKIDCDNGTVSIVKNSLYDTSSGTAQLIKTQEPKNHITYIEPNESPLYRAYKLTCSNK